MNNMMYIIFSGIMSVTMMIPPSSCAQQRIVAGNFHIASGKSETKKREDLKNSLIKISRSQTFMLPVKDGVDTLNYPLPGEYALYLSDGGGYVSGNNEFGDLAKANYFALDQTYHITGLLVDFAVATGGKTTVEFAVWDNTGPGASPGNKLGSGTIDLQSIVSDVQNEITTYIVFDPPVNLTAGFYAGVYLPDGQGDTLAIFTNTNGDTSPATAWEQWNDFVWYAYDHPSGWGIEVSHAIFPIVVQGELLEADFSASATAVLVGGSVQFSDLSKGDPDAWEWSFDGGDPPISNLQNPEIHYGEEGVFSVSLTVTKGDESSTKTIANYITVAEVIPPVIDTLNFPLPGNYVLYIMDNSGGYVNGNNIYNDLAKANYFPFSEEAKITGVLFDFAVAKGGNPSIELSIWNNSGIAGSPGSKIDQTTISHNSIKADVQNQQLTYVPFNPPVAVSQSFYAGFYLPTAAGDTLVVWGNDHGDTDPGTAWELWDDLTWHAFSSQASWQLDIALGIHPIVEYVTGISDHIAHKPISVYPNPGSGFIRLNTPDHISETIIVKAVTLDGKVVFRSPLAFQNGSAFLDLSHLPSGFYFLQGTGLEMVFSVKLIIN
jgi:PKD repeat protein